MTKIRRNPHKLAIRLLCHAVSISIAVVLTVFASDGAMAVWPAHPRIACSLAALCAIAAGIGHMLFCQQFERKKPMQSFLLLGIAILMFGTVSVTLSAITEYREATVPIVQPRDAVILTRDNSLGEQASDPTRIHSIRLVMSFCNDLRRGSPEAVVPFFLGCFLEGLPLATLLLLVRR